MENDAQISIDFLDFVVLVQLKGREGNTLYSHKVNISITNPTSPVKPP